MLAKLRQVLGGLLVLAALGAAAFFLIHAFWRAGKASPEVTAALVTALVAAGGLVYSRRAEQTREHEHARREQMAPTYEGLIRLFFSLGGQGGQAPPSEEELQRYFFELTQKLLIWAPAGVVLEWGAWKEVAALAASAEDEQPPEQLLVNLVAFERLILAMRKDLGHRDRALTPTSLLRLFVNDLPPTTTGE